MTRSQRMRAAALAPGFTPETGAVPFPGYRLGRLRGRGGFGTVWEATGPTGEPLAMKFMSSHQSSTTIRELKAIQAIASLQHPHLLPINNVWSIPGQIAFTMELADASLLDLMVLYVEEFDRYIEVSKLLMFLGQIADALDFLNSRRHSWDGRTIGFQHGDVKPNNILLTDDVAKLADYGLATPMINRGKTPCQRHGTVEYVAPEVFQGYVADTSDQFGLAVTYHLLRTNMFPYPAPPPPDKLPKGFTRPPPDLSHVTPPERAVLTRALSVVPQDRYPTCKAFIRALMTAVAPQMLAHTIG